MNSVLLKVAHKSVLFPAHILHSCSIDEKNAKIHLIRPGCNKGRYIRSRAAEDLVMYVSDYLKDNNAIIKQLRAIPALNSFKDDDLRGILKLSRMIKCEPGEKIIEEGEVDNLIYFLVSGEVGIEKEGETITILKRRGDLFGEMGIIDGSPRSASIVAIEETACLAVDASYVDQLKGDEKMAFTAILYRVFSEILASRLRDADIQLVKEREEKIRLQAEIKKLKSQLNPS